MPAGSYVKRMPWGRQKPLVGYGIDWSHPLAQGLVGCWLFNAGSGSVANDLAKKNDAIFTVPPTWRNGAVVLSDVSNQRALIRDVDILNSEFTIVVDVDGGGDYQHVVSRHGSWRIRNNNLTPCFDVQTSANNIVNFGDSTLLSTRRQMVGVRKYAAIEAYLNGKFITQTAITPPITVTNNTSAIGGYYVGTAGYQWSGSIFYIYIFTSALSADNIAQLYAEPYCFIEGWNYGRSYSVPSSAFINSTYWYQNPILEAI